MIDQRQCAADAAPAVRSERIVIRCPEGPEPWLEECAQALCRLPDVEVVAWLGPGARAALPDGRPWIDELAASASTELQRDRVTLLIDLSERSLPPGLEGMRRWLPVFGESALPRFSFSGSLLDHRRAVLARLLEMTGADEGSVLEEGRLRPVPHSPTATHARLRSSVARWPARVLSRMGAGCCVPVTTVTPGADAGAPSRMQELVAVLGALAARLQVLAVEESWAIGVIERPIARLLGGMDGKSIQWLPSPDDAGLADPFALADDGDLQILAELAHRSRPGLIVACSRADTSEPRPVLPTDGHASYPYLIEDGPDIFMLPERSACGRVQLFRADPFPDRWLPDAVLLEDVAGVDATITRYRGRWWLFTGDLADQADARLHLFMSDQLRGPWRKHPCSPVKDDLASARSAGTPFVVAGRLYRPAQDCSRRYGEAVVIHRVDVLTPEAYAETAVVRIEADPAGPYPHGVHTVSDAGALTLIDGKRERRSLCALLRAVRQFLA